jgi:hypothetical protein
VVLTKRDLTEIFVALRALVDGTDPMEANRVHSVGIAMTLTRAIQREGDEP